MVSSIPSFRITTYSQCLPLLLCWRLLVFFETHSIFYTNSSFRLKTILMSGSPVTTLTFLSLLRLTKPNIAPTSNVLRILRRKHVRQTLSLVSSSICSRRLGESISNGCGFNSLFLYLGSMPRFREKEPFNLATFLIPKLKPQNKNGLNSYFRMKSNFTVILYILIIFLHPPSSSFLYSYFIYLNPWLVF